MNCEFKKCHLFPINLMKKTYQKSKKKIVIPSLFEANGFMCDKTGTDAMKDVCLNVCCKICVGINRNNVK